VERSTAHENGQYGVWIQSGFGSSIDGNLATYNGERGFYVNDGNNLIVRNRARGNTLENYTINPGSDYGVILTNPGQGFSSSAAWANFAY
jgi:parallel beta-helix repeat protein